MVVGLYRTWLFVIACAAGCPFASSQTFNEAKFNSLVTKIEADVLELAKSMEAAYRSRCDPVHLKSCGGTNYDHCLSDLPDQTCPGGEDLDTPECSGGEGSSCSALYSYSASSVAIPGNLVSGPKANPTDPKVIETVCFTKALDKYALNKREQDQAFWDELGQRPSAMYFGGVSGAFRISPGQVYSTCGAYDPRIRPWYVAASSGPRNIVLVLDKSGSMQVNDKIGLLKEAAKRIIQTSTVADRILLVPFDDDADAITDDGLVFIATAENKQRLLKAVDKLEARGGTNFRAAFEKAFDVLEQSVKEELTVNCNTAVIFLTDGMMTAPQGLSEQDVVELVQDRLAKASVRLSNVIYLFTYSISGGETDIEAFPSELACAVETGIYAKIEFAEDIVVSLTEYYKFFALGLGSDGNEDFVAWAEPYKWIPGDAIGTTVSAPVFDRTKRPHLFVGVVGIDFTLAALDKALGVTDSSSDESFRRVVLRSTARCPRLEFSTCELESYRLQGTAGQDALCTRNCTADDFVQVAEQECLGVSDYPSDLWDNVRNKDTPFRESVCCKVGETFASSTCATQSGPNVVVIAGSAAAAVAVLFVVAYIVFGQTKKLNNTQAPIAASAPPIAPSNSFTPTVYAQPVSAGSDPPYNPHIHW